MYSTKTIEGKSVFHLLYQASLLCRTAEVRIGDEDDSSMLLVKLFTSARLNVHVNTNLALSQVGSKGK